jgi:hypothetical protein
MADGYRGVIGAFPYALRNGDSLFFRLYVVVGTLVALFLGGLFTLSIVVQIGNTASAPGGSLTLSRTFVAVVGLFVAGPLLAPTLLVARKHRKGLAYHPRYDTIMAATGFAFMLSIYLAAIISVPDSLRSGPPTGALAPLLSLLYALPRIGALVPPTGMLGAMAAIHYLLSR